MLKDEFLTQAEVEERIGFGMTTIYKWVKKGLFPKPFKPGGKMGFKYYPIKEIEAWERGEYPKADNQ